jgi:hypothetical protein
MMDEVIGRVIGRTMNRTMNSVVGSVMDRVAEKLLDYGQAVWQGDRQVGRYYYYQQNYDGS